MKKTLGIILMISVMFSAAVISAAAESSYIRGDADGDGTVSVLDATVIQRQLAHLSTSAFDEIAADVDSNGLDILDATGIQRYLACYENLYGIGEKVITTLETSHPVEKPTQDEYELPFIPN